FLIASCTAVGIATLENLYARKMQSSRMHERFIPSSNEKIPVVGLGTWQQLDDAQDSLAAKQLSEVLKNVLEKGGRVIDASPMQGRAESQIGDVLQAGGRAEAYAYATQVWTRGRQEGIQQMEEPMRKMRRTPTDLMQVHNLMD